MPQLNTEIDKKVTKSLGVYRAATFDGYWEDKAQNDIQYVFLLGQLRATKSIHASFGNKSTARRIKTLERKIEELSHE